MKIKNFNENLEDIEETIEKSDITKDIIDILFKYRIDFSNDSLYTDFGIREEDFEKIANEISNLCQN